ncbi:MAG: tetratricopeptide repeat protein [Geothrix sp.]|uniref:O-linked N-acetylglucosamine transferase, SPINDLY family protein n=1 Tax=Geothrix sp. TaxID=1962974 RepID=UPI003BB13BC2
MTSHTALVDQLNHLIALFNEGRAPEVEDEARALLGAFPLSGEAWLILGTSLQAQAKPALAALKRAVSLLPEDAGAHCNLGVALEHAARLPEAEASYRKALSINERLIDAHCFLGHTLRKQARADEAIQSYRAALEIDPTHYQANHGLKSALTRVGRLVEAEDLCRSALHANPDFDEMRQILCNTLCYLSKYDDVVRESNQALERHPGHPVIWEQRLYCFSYHPDLSAEEIFREFVSWGNQHPVPQVDFSAHDRNPDRRLRIGYVSPDFRKHTSRFYFWPLFLNHDRSTVELFAYSNVQHEVAWTKLFREQFEHWRDIRGLDDEAAARMIKEDRIDILVDLCGHMEGERLGVFALKPAPIQATWLGSAWTTGLKAIDYALFDPHVAPEGTLTSETIYRLPQSFMVFQPPVETADIVPPPCLNNGFVTFGYTGRTERLNHRTFLVWGEILRRLPEARLILDFGPFSDPRTQAHYRGLLSGLGLDTDRMIMRKSPKIFQGLNDIDILLDSFPHGGGTMLMDALWMGVPFVSLASRPPVGRLGLGMLMNLGLPEWVATTEAEYVEKACMFAGDHELLSALRLGMRERMRNSPLMDGPGFARAFESAYRFMFGAWLKESSS